MQLPDSILNAERPHGAGRHLWNIAANAARREDILPVVSNPNAEISEMSKIGGLGKTPSRYNTRGKVSGFADWTSYEATTDDLKRWSKVDDYGICIQTRHVRAIDVDITDPKIADSVSFCIEQLLDFDLPVRRRPNSSKFLLAFAMEGEFTKRRMLTKTQPGETSNAIEFLANGQQFVAAGRHPSGVHYAWDGGFPTAFPTLTEDDFERVWACLVKNFATEVHTVAPTVALAKKRSVDDITDPVVDYLEEFWHVLGVDRSGRVDIVCPWEHEHSTESGESSTSYFPSGVGGMSKGHFKCLHSHCQARSESEWQDAIGLSLHGFEVLEDEPEEEDDAPEAWELVDTKVDTSKLTDREKRLKALDGIAPMRVTVTNHVAFARDTCKNIPHDVAAYRNSKEKGVYAGHILADRIPLSTALADPKCCGVNLAYDEFLDALMVGNQRGTHWTKFRDEHYTRLATYLEGGFNGLFKFENIRTSILKEVVNLVGFDKRFDSLKSLAMTFRGKWDGVKRIEQFFPRYVRTEDTPYTRSMGLYLWTAIAGRMLQPGIKADMVPIIIGAQGARKTSLVKAMALSEDYFVELDLHRSEADLAREMRGKVIAELGEMKGFGAKQIENVKAFISRGTESWIPKYCEFATEYPRRAMFIGTSNDDEALPDDSTGHRRWLPVTIPEGFTCDVEGLEVDREQLYAEAIEMFIDQGVMWDVAENLAKAQHGDYQKSDPWEDVLHSYLFDANIDGVTPVDNQLTLLSIALGSRLVASAGEISIPISHRLGRCLRKLGLKRVVRQRKKVWIYDRPKP